MKRISSIAGTAVCLLRDNIDTDSIIPSREIKSVSKSGLGPGLFADWRYNDSEKQELNPDFILNASKYLGARILFAGANFGCGSSREHAVWALRDNGFDAIVAPSFGRIFYDNCICNGLLPVTLQAQSIRKIAEQIEQSSAAPVIRIDAPCYRGRSRRAGQDFSSSGIRVAGVGLLIVLLCWRSRLFQG